MSVDNRLALVMGAARPVRERHVHHRPQPSAASPGADPAYRRRPPGAAMTMAVLVRAALACRAAKLYVLDGRRCG
jgi:hypothetical protein